MLVLRVVIRIQVSVAPVAANFATFAWREDTAGSIIGPASSTELEGTKSTRGLVSPDSDISRKS